MYVYIYIFISYIFLSYTWTISYYEGEFVGNYIYIHTNSPPTESPCNRRINASRKVARTPAVLKKESGLGPTPYTLNPET